MNALSRAVATMATALVSVTGVAISAPVADAATTTTTTLDVVNAYTPAAANAVGGRKAVLDISSRSIAETNMAMARSGVPIRLRLVDTVESSGTPESAGESAMLTGLRTPGTSTFASARDARTRTKAHALMLFSGPINSGGLSVVNTASSPGSSVGIVDITDEKKAPGTIYAHEFGHVLGLKHDTGVDPSTSGINRGFTDAAHGVRDVMSYSNACTKAERICDQKLIYSDPNRTLEGQRLGSSNANAAGYLRSRTSAYAGLGTVTRQPVVTNSSIEPGASNVGNMQALSVDFNQNVTGWREGIWLEDINGHKVSTYRTYDLANKRIIIRPNSPLRDGQYRIWLGSSVSGSGMHLAEQTVPFSVGDGPHLTSSVAGKGTRPTIRMTFSRDVTNVYSAVRVANTKTNEKPKFTVAAGTMYANGSVTYPIIPDVDLVKGQSYTVRLSGQTDASGLVGPSASYTFTVN